MDFSFDIKANYAEIEKAQQELARLSDEYDALKAKISGGNFSPTELEGLNKQVTETFDNMQQAVERLSSLSSPAKLSDGMQLAAQGAREVGTALDAVDERMRSMRGGIENIIPTDGRMAETLRETAAQIDEVQTRSAALRDRFNEVAQSINGQKTATDEASDALHDMNSASEEIVTTAPKFEGTIKQQMRSLGNLIQEDTELLRKMGEEYDALSQKMERLQAKRSVVANNPTQDDSTAQGVRNFKLGELDAQIAPIQARMTQIKTDTSAYKAEITACTTEMSRLSQEAAASSIRSAGIRTQMRQARQVVAQMIMDGKTGTAEFGVAVNKANQLAAAFAKAGMAISGKSLGYNAFNLMSTSIQGVTGAMSTYMGVAALFTDNQEELQKVQKNLMAVMTLSTGVQQLMTAATQISVKWDALKASALAAVTTAEGGATTAAGAQAAANAAEATSAGVATAANWTLAASFRAVGLAIKSIPVIGWVLAGLSAVIAVIVAIVKHVKKARAEAAAYKTEAQKIADEVKAMQKSWRENDVKAHKKMNEEIASSVGKSVAAYKSLKKEWESLGKNAKKQKEFINDHTSDFDNLGVAIGGVNDANDFFINQTDSFIESCKARAKAIAAIHLAEEKEEENMKLEMENEKLENSTTFTSTTKWKKGDKVSGATWRDLRAAWKRLGYTFIEDKNVEDTKKINAEYGKGLQGHVLTSKELSAIDREVQYRLQKNKDNAKIKANKERISDNDKETSSLYEKAEEASKKADDLNKHKPAKTFGKGGASGRSAEERLFEIKQRNEQLRLAEQEAFNDKSEELANRYLENCEDNARKEIAQIEADRDAQLTSLNDWLRELAQKRKDVARENWLSAKDGRTEAQWSKTSEGAKDDAYWENLLVRENKDIGNLFAAYQKQIYEAADEARGKVVNNLISNYTNEAERERAESVKKLKTDIAAIEAALAEYEQKGDAANAATLRTALAEANRQRAWVTEAKDAWNAYFQEYGTFLERRRALQEQFEHETAGMATSSPEYLTKQRRFEEDLSTLTLETFKKEMDWDNIFGDLSRLSKAALDTLATQIETLIKKEKTLSVKAVDELRAALEKVRQEQTSKGNIIAAAAGISKLRAARRAKDAANKEVNEADGGKLIAQYRAAETTEEREKVRGKKVTDPTDGSLTTFGKLLDRATDAVKRFMQAQDGASRSIQSAGKGLSQIAQLGNSVGDLLGQFGVDLPEGFSTAFSGLGQMGDAMNAFDVTKPGSLLNITNYVKFASGLTSVFTGIADGLAELFGGNDSIKDYEDAAEELEKMSSLWDTLIAKKKEYAELSFGDTKKGLLADAVTAAEANLKALQDTAEKYGKAHTWNAHSHAYRSDRAIGSATFAQMSQVLGRNITTVQDLLNLTNDELVKLMEVGGGDWWTKLDDTQRDYIQQIADANDEIQDLNDSIAATAQGITFDDMVQSFGDAMRDMNKTYDDFVDEITDKMRNAVIDDAMDGAEDELKALYQKYKDLAEKQGGKLTAEQIEQRKEDFKNFAQKWQDKRDESVEAYGLDESTTEENQKNSYATASEDSIEELNGRMLANNEALYSIRALLTAPLTENAPIIAANVTTITGTLNVIREAMKLQQDIRENSYLELQSISQNTRKTAEALSTANIYLEKVYKNTKNN